MFSLSLNSLCSKAAFFWKELHFFTLQSWPPDPNPFIVVFHLDCCNSFCQLIHNSAARLLTELSSVSMRHEAEVGLNQSHFFHWDFEPVPMIHHANVCQLFSLSAHLNHCNLTCESLSQNLQLHDCLFFKKES